MKQRFSALDIRASVHDIKERIIGLRLQNVYDINSKTLLLKFSQPDRKEYLVVESGIRLHLTDFAREKAITPSMFCVKLRKHLRTRRLTGVRQAGVDRIVQFEFSAVAGSNAPGTYHLICEFFASGNIILVDHEFTVLTLLRIVKISPPKDTKEQSKAIPSSKAKKIEDKKTDLKDNPFSLAVKDVYDINALSREFSPASVDLVLNKIQETLISTNEWIKKSPKETLKKIVNNVCLYGPPLSEHILLEMGLNPNVDIFDKDFDYNESSFRVKLSDALQFADQIIQDLYGRPSLGYIVIKDDQLEEFHPILFNQHRKQSYKEFPTFIAALDTFFSNIESQRALQRAKAQEASAHAKLAGIKAEQMGRVDALNQAELHNRKLAAAIEANLEIVDQIILVLRSLLASAMDWQELADLVKDEARQGNHLAQSIHALQLHKNTATISLPALEANLALEKIMDDDEASDEDIAENEAVEGASTSSLIVEIDLGLSAHGNASKFYHLKKASTVKKDKTLAIAETAFKNAEEKVQQDLRQARTVQPHAGVTRMRKPFWFEKFMWFPSSEGYLVIAGRDLQQNEVLVKRYLTKGDLYVHADMHGAATVIIKNPSGRPVPPTTLNQAGTLSICQSRAWEAKILTSAWWVFHHQVSKTAPTGEYLAAGSFMIRGKKNFLAPAALTYGFSLLYVLDAPSTARRLQARIQREQDHGIVPDSDSFEPEGQDFSLNIEYNNDGTTNEYSAKNDECDQETSKDRNSFENKGLAEGHSSAESDNEDCVDATPDKYGLLPSDLLQVQAQEKGILEEDQTIKSPLKEKQPNKNFKAFKKNPKAKAKNDSVVPRGQRSKQKKLNSKYADQDEEDRQARMALLGSQGAPQPKGKKAKKVAEQKRLREEQIRAREESISKDTASSKQKNNVIDNVAIAPDVSTKDDLIENPDAQEEIRQLLEEENVVILDDSTQSLQSYLDSLVGELQEDEVAEYVIPLAAPYTALSKFKFKVKIQPGLMKKGKAAKTALGMFNSMSNCLESDRKLIRQIPESESINAIFAKCKVVPPPNFIAAKNKNASKAKSDKKKKSSAEE